MFENRSLKLDLFALALLALCALLATSTLTYDAADPAGLALFWGSLGLSLVVAFVVALPVNRWLISRGLGHAVVMEHGGHHGHEGGH